MCDKRSSSRAISEEALEDPSHHEVKESEALEEFSPRDGRRRSSGFSRGGSLRREVGDSVFRRLAFLRELEAPTRSTPSGSSWAAVDPPTDEPPIPAPEIWVSSSVTYFWSIFPSPPGRLLSEMICGLTQGSDSETSGQPRVARQKDWVAPPLGFRAKRYALVRGNKRSTLSPIH